MSRKETKCEDLQNKNGSCAVKNTRPIRPLVEKYSITALLTENETVVLFGRDGSVKLV